MCEKSSEEIYKSISNAVGRDSYAAFAMALREYDNGKQIDSLKHITESLLRSPADDIRRMLMHHLFIEEMNRSVVLFNAGNLEAAAEGFSALAAVCPDRVEAKANLGVVVNAIMERSVALHTRGDFEEAERGYRFVLRHASDNEDALHLLSLIVKKRGDFLGCLSVLSRLAIERPYRPALHHNLSNTIGEVIEWGDALLAEGDEACAAAHYTAAATCLDDLRDREHPLSQRGYVVNINLPLRLRAELVYANTHGHILIDEFRDYLPDAPVILECGGADGSDSVQLSQTFPAGMVVSIEASPREYEILSSRTATYSNIKAFNMALSDHDGHEVIYILKRDIGQNSILEPASGELKDYDRWEIPCSTIDSLAKRNNLDRIDMMWLDMEGAELQALRNAEEILRTTSVVYTEVSPSGMKGHKNACTYDDLRMWLEERGFVVERELVPWSGGGNVLFVRKSLSLPAEGRRFR
jgi:2-O-methyltransferase